MTTINPAYTTSEVGRQLVMSKAKYILTIKKSLKIVEDAIEKTKSKTFASALQHFNGDKIRSTF